MAKEYIEREALIDEISAAMKHGGMGDILGQTLRRYVMRQPAADVVEVVRCKECTFRLRGGYCKTVTGGRATQSVDDTFFCGYGERRDNDAAD